MFAVIRTAQTLMALTGIANDGSGSTNAQLIEALKETRARTLELVDDLNEAQLVGPRLQIVNSLLWEMGHVAWFQEFWVLRHLGRQQPIVKQGDELYDSARVAHDMRRDLPLLGKDETLDYMRQALEGVIEQAGDASHQLTGCGRLRSRLFPESGVVSSKDQTSLKSAGIWLICVERELEVRGGKDRGVTTALSTRKIRMRPAS